MTKKELYNNLLANNLKILNATDTLSALKNYLGNPPNTRYKKSLWAFSYCYACRGHVDRYNIYFYKVSSTIFCGHQRKKKLRHDQYLVCLSCYHIRYIDPTSYGGWS